MPLKNISIPFVISKHTLRSSLTYTTTCLSECFGIRDTLQHGIKYKENNFCLQKQSNNSDCKKLIESAQFNLKNANPTNHMISFLPIRLVKILKIANNLCWQGYTEQALDGRINWYKNFWKPIWLMYQKC